MASIFLGHAVRSGVWCYVCSGNSQPTEYVGVVSAVD